MSLNYHVIGKRIRNYRQLKNLSQNSVAEKIDKSPTYISYIESGTKHPSLETLVDLAKLLEVSVDMPLGGDNEHNRFVEEMEYQQVLHDCTEQEKRFLMEVVRVLKEILRSVRC